MAYDEHDEAMVEGARRNRERRERARREGPPTLAGQLARVGVLGWIVVTPTLLGAWLGGRLDHALNSGILFSGALIAAGIALGSWSAWKWMHGP